MKRSYSVFTLIASCFLFLVACQSVASETVDSDLFEEKATSADSEVQMKGVESEEVKILNSEEGADVDSNLGKPINVESEIIKVSKNSTPQVEVANEVGTSAQAQAKTESALETSEVFEDEMVEESALEDVFDSGQMPAELNDQFIEQGGWEAV